MRKRGWDHRQEALPGLCGREGGQWGGPAGTGLAWISDCGSGRGWAGVLSPSGVQPPYPGAVAEVENHPCQDVIHPGQDVDLRLGCHLTVGKEKGAAGPFPTRVLRVLAVVGGGDMTVRLCHTPPLGD